MQVPNLALTHLKRITVCDFVTYYFKLQFGVLEIEKKKFCMQDKKYAMHILLFPVYSL